MSNGVTIRSIQPEMPFAATAREVLLSQMAVIEIWSVFLGQPDRAFEHHQMRIATKRLRYSVELFEELFPQAAERCLPDLRALQNELGALHDLDALFLSIEATLSQEQSIKKKKRYEANRARSAQQRISLETLLSVTAAERDARHQGCVMLWGELRARDAFALLRDAVSALPV